MIKSYSLATIVEDMNVCGCEGRGREVKWKGVDVQKEMNEKDEEKVNEETFFFISPTAVILRIFLDRSDPIT